jgi:acyl dehydratase
MIDPKFIGLSSEARYVYVERGQLRFFAHAIGETDPIYTDEAAARAAGYAALPAPPTFLFTLGLLAPAEKGSLQDLGVPIERVLHGEQHFTYVKPILAGDRIKLVTTITAIEAKKGGALEFVTQETVAENQLSEIVGRARTVIVVRN